MSAALPEGAWLNPRAAAGGFRLDTVVLDVDGVLIDVRESFREAVRETVVTLQRSLGVAAPWKPSHEDILVFKRGGGFNDDIDLSIALTAIGAAGRGEDAATIARDTERAGGGLPALRAAAPELPRIAGREVLRIFDDLYWGGLVDRERALVPPDFPQRLRDAGARHVALVTGRTPRELDAALQRLGWDRLALCHAVTGDVVRKPDPACLDEVAQRCNPLSMVYVGDVRDDWELVRRWREERAGGVPVRGILVGEDAEMEGYRPLGVDATVRESGDVLAVLPRWR
ncbi:MAG TPA: HAD family hydrolase [Candidatus Dormibacteraeota bacterium]|nr:HAD family hydrolase [Candidatus Dormibacteraeota bacterium]